jgi:hypothetical protein
VLFCLAVQILYASPPNLRGSLDIHDPSAVIKCGNLYYVFGTGQGIISKSSADKVYWVTGPSVFANSPNWTTSTTKPVMEKIHSAKIIFQDYYGRTV